MAKRKILNRRSSRSSRYTGSGILDPDTDVMDNAYPCWWKDLENNTIVRPSINYNMLNETSRHLDSSSRIETSKIVNEWWKALDTSISSLDSENRIEKGASKLRVATSESEEEIQVKKRKLPLRSKAKIHENNAFFNILNDSEDSSKKISTPDTRDKKNSTTNSDSSNKTLINEEQLTNTKDSRSIQSSNLNNILKSKPKIFKKNYKNQRRSIFVDALQDNEFKVPPQKGSSVNEFQKMDEKNCSNMISADNQSESSDFASFLNGVHDLSHLPAPKAQSTTVEDSSSHNSTKSSTSDAEYEIMKPKPKLLRHTTKSIKKNVFENTSVNEETDKGTKTGNLKSIVENIEKSKSLKRRTRSTKRNVFEDVFAAEESDMKAETSKLTNVESIEIAKQSSILSSNDLSKSLHKLQKNVVNEDDNSDTEKMIQKKRSVNLRKLRDADTSTRSENLIGSDSTTKGKTARQKSMQNQDSINDKSDENILNVTEVQESASKDSNDKEVSNELQNTNGEHENISLGRCVVDNVSSFNRKEYDSTMNRGKSLSKTSKSTSSVKKERINRKISNVIDEDVRNVGRKGSNRNKSNETENRSRSSHRTSNITSMESSGNMPIHEYADTSNVNNKNIKAVEAISKDSGDKEMLSKSQYADNSDLLQNKSVSNDLSNVKNSNRLSSRNSNLKSSLKKIDTSVNASKIGDKNVRDERKSVSVSFRNRLSSRVSNSTSFTRNINDTIEDRNALNVDDKTAKDAGVDDTSDSNNEELVRKVPRTSHRSVANVSSSTSEKEVNDEGYRNRVSSRSRASSLASFQTIGDTHTNRANVDDKNVREVQDEVTSDSDEELANRIQRLSRKSAANVTRNADRKERDHTENRGKLSFSEKRSEKMNTNTTEVGDKNLKDTEDKVLSDSGAEELIHNESRLSRRKLSANASSSFDEKERERTENRITVPTRTNNLVPVVKVTRMNIMIPSVDNRDGRETEGEELIGVGNEAISNKLRHSDKDGKNISRSSSTNMSYNNNRRKRSTRENRGSSLFRSSNLISSTKSFENTDANSLNVDDKDGRGVRDEEPRVNGVQRLSERSAIGSSSSFNRNGRSDTENHDDRISSRASNPVSTEIVADVNSNNRNVDGNNLMETEDEAANKLENVSKKQGNAFNRKTSNLLKRMDNNTKEFEELMESKIRSALKTKKQSSILSFFNFNESPAAEKKKREQIRTELDKVKRQEMNCMNANVQQQKTQPSSTVRTNINGRKKLMSKSRKKPTVPEQVNKAYLVNGQVYKVPRLPRPKTWVTDRLYNYLWKLMEPKYKLETRVISEKFIRRVSMVTTSIAKQKLYQNYKGELYALMKEMARLGIVRTRNDFYNFCHDFFPYELRAKMVPMLLPGNKRNIPYDPSTLYKPILGS